MEENDQDYQELKSQVRSNSVGQQLGLKFDSDFESGNLDLAALTFADRDDEYDLILRLDSNCRGHQQWYYFSVSS